MRLYFDFISPYAYLAWTQVHALAERHGRTVEPVPVLFAAMLNHWGHKGPAEIPPKRMYVFKDVLRTAHMLGLPLAPPPSHPFNPLLALRVASLDMPEETRRALIDALFGATWGGGPGVTSPTVVGQLASGHGVDDAVERAAAPDVKARVKDNTAAAIEAGVFGVPTVICDGELFWGYDSFGHLDRFLADEDPLPRSEELLERWSSVAPSAER
ncbi:MAG: 2-hydroxychromene-2-carboxylate isomerase [Proteobacteria bacterium]|nr:2-hydroxychromene-2-carboxylate isomerase [Pseudomonadota bacterium]MCP4920919.1 2-hydroxychromene-2-carboxylate isomerase [Pseudomonadota bacterium]